MVNCNGRNILRAYNFPVAKDGHFSDQNVRLAARLQFFDQTIAPVTPLGAAHRAIFRRLLHMMIGTRDFVGWKRQWHEILHHYAPLKCGTVAIITTSRNENVFEKKHPFSYAVEMQLGDGFTTFCSPESDADFFF